METHSLSERSRWLFSRRADFWLACGGASVGLIAAVLVILCRGDRELDGLDLVLSEFHLGATYGAIMQTTALASPPSRCAGCAFSNPRADLRVLDERPNDVAHIDRHVCRRLAPRATESRSGPLLPAGDGRACVARAPLVIPWSHLSADVGGNARLHSFGPGGLRRETLFRAELRRGNYFDSGLGRSSHG